MNQHTAFLDAIRENPEDDGPRLVYADWLDEHGDAERAEFIRAQCELARLEVDDERFPAVRQRVSELLAKNGREWTEALRRFARVYSIERGFADHVTLPADTFFAHAHEVFAVAPVWHVKLRNLKDRTRDRVPDLAKCPILEKLSSINLDTNGLGVGHAQTLLSSRFLGRLTSLDFSNNKIGLGGARALGACPHLGQLVHLRLDSSAIGNNGLAALVESPHMPRLRTLGLHGNGLGHAGIEALANSPSAAGLTDLDLSTNPRFTADTLRALASSPHLARLGTLRLGNTYGGTHGQAIMPEGLAALAESPTLNELHTLDLDGLRSLTDEALTALAGARGLPGLKTLCLARCQINPMNSLIRSTWRLVGPEGFANFVRGPLLGRLRLLDLAGNHVGLPGVQALAESPQAANLVSLTLASCYLTDEALATLAGSPHLARLCVLSLRSNAFGDAGARALAASPHLNRLHTIHVWNNDALTDKGRQALAGRFGPCAACD
jgi:uncharacterized protein (TIGR02996 family)